MVSVLGKLFGDTNEKAVKKILPICEKVNALEAGIQKLSDAHLHSKTDEFKGRLDGKETLDDLLPEAFSVAREVARRRLGQRHFDVQMMSGRKL